jgi:membrane-bound ClpP family serine protease
MPVVKKKRAYTLYSLVRLLFDEVILVAVLLWLLPRFGINIPVWLLIVFMVVWAVYSYLTSKLVTKVIGRAVAVGTEALIGVKCTTTTPLSPGGYVRVGTELWQARSMTGNIEIGSEVVIIDINRLTLLVRPSTDTFDEGQHARLKSEVSCTQNEGHSSTKPQPREN